MSTTTRAQRFAAMDSWLSRLDREVLILRKNEFVFWDVQRMIRRNSQLRVPSEFYAWLGRMYVGGMSVGIRRQVDSDTRTQSFVRFRNRLKGNTSIISRSHYRGLYPTAQRQFADRTYDSFVGRGRAQLFPYQVERQIQTLYRRSATLVEFADREAAHMSATPPSNLRRFGEPGHVIKYLSKLVQFYMQLFRATHVNMTLRNLCTRLWRTGALACRLTSGGTGEGACPPLIGSDLCRASLKFVYDWRAPFRVTWLP